MRTIVIGFNEFKDYPLLCKECLERGVTSIITNGVGYVNELAINYAESNTIPYQVYYPAYYVYGDLAESIRDIQMLINGQAEQVIVFWDSKVPITKNIIDVDVYNGIDTHIIMI